MKQLEKLQIVHGALLEVSWLGAAQRCDINIQHHPIPSRFIWHHVTPEACGGPTDSGNLVSLCDSCHYTIHAFMFWMARHPGDFHDDKHMRGARAQQYRWALLGYQQAVRLGTEKLIPNEGGTVVW